jgi:hypothetical protein
MTRYEEFQNVKRVRRLKIMMRNRSIATLGIHNFGQRLGTVPTTSHTCNCWRMGA